MTIQWIANQTGVRMADIKAKTAFIDEMDIISTRIYKTLYQGSAD